ncbi:MAG: hypothetical protein QOE27_362 [Solirubrobacteraceae bacterium]|nr:hypothetical protein [Solirubrobacteraceae bacterium]
MPGSRAPRVKLAGWLGVLAAVLVGLVGSPPAEARGRLLGLVARTAPARLDAGGPAVPPGAAAGPAASASQGGSVTYQGGPVMHAHQTFVIFWDPDHAFTEDFKARVDRFLTDVGADGGTATNVYSVAAQYSDPTGPVGYRSSFGGSYTDPTPFALQSCAASLLGLSRTPCITDDQIQAELAAALRATGWGPGLDRAYFVLTPAGIVSCQDLTGAQCSTNAYCGYHSQLDPAVYPSFPDADPVIYGHIPWSAVAGCQTPDRPNGSDADPAVNLISHEHIEMLTDPIVDRPAWIGSDGSEIADKCRSTYGTPSGPAGAGYDQTIDGDNYLLQAEYSNAGQACLLRTADDQAPVAAFAGASADGLSFSFDASGSTDPDGRVIAYRWDFGDGQSGTGAQVTHAYTGTGDRTVTLSVADNAGAQASTTRVVALAALPPPPPPPPPGPSPGPAPAPAPGPSPPAGTDPAPPPGSAAPSGPAAATSAPVSPASGSAPASDPAGAPGSPAAPAATLAAPASPPVAGGTRLKASAVWGVLGARGLAGSVTVDRRVPGRVDLLISRAVATRLRIRAVSDGGPRSAEVIVGQAVLGAVGPGRAGFRVRLTGGALGALRRLGAVVVEVRVTLRPAGEPARTLSARRRLHV